jgi:hypothetical protein
MSAALVMMSDLLDLAIARPVAATGPAGRTRFTLAAGLGALFLAALWGLAAGSASLGLALTNAYKLPMVVLLSSLCAVPAGVLALKLCGKPLGVRDLLLSFATAVFAGCLALAVLSPLVALYYNTSAWAGPYLGIGSAVLAIVVSVASFVRAAVARVEPGSKREIVAIPIVVMTFMQLASLLQLIALASPILPETTVFDSGIDHVVRGDR